MNFEKIVRHKIFCMEWLNEDRCRTSFRKCQKEIGVSEFRSFGVECLAIPQRN